MAQLQQIFKRTRYAMASREIRGGMFLPALARTSCYSHGVAARGVVASAHMKTARAARVPQDGEKAYER